MDRDSFIVSVKTDDTYKDIAVDIETKFETLNFELDRPLPKVKSKKVIGLTEDELDKQIMKWFVGLKGNNDEDKKAKSAKMCVIKRKLKIQDYKNCLEAAQIPNEINHLEKVKLM